MIEFRNVSKVYNNGTEALHNINLKVEKGEFVFIVGSSGAGKSTFLNNPSMIIADEPTGNIDPALSYEIVDLLSAINERGTTVLMVTHEHSLVKHFHKRIIQIHSGEIVADTAAISKEQQAAAQAVATQETVAVDREAIRRAKEARAKADADAQPYATKEFTAPQNNDQANG